MTITDQQLLDPGFMLEATGTVLDQSTDQMVPYDVDRVAPYLQRKILSYVGDTPKDDEGYNKWLMVLSSRQVGKSLCSALALYYHVAYRPGTYAALITDTKDRSKDLFRNILNCHDNMPEAYKSPTIKSRELNQLTFAHNGKLRTLSAEQSNVGIGRAMSFGHLSELPFMDDPATMWNGLYPAITNRKEAALIMESTPAQMTLPGASWYQDMCNEAQMGQNRFEFVFAPFYSSMLNERKWHADWSLDKEELRLLERFGPKNGEPVSNPGEWRYLTLENLAFRRSTMANDAEVRRHPELFLVFYPTDAVTCWQQVGGAAIPAHALQRHIDSILVPWNPHNGYQEYQGPKESAVYVIGADPAGWMGGDQASFVVLEVWGDEWIQVAEFSSNVVIPVDFARKICEVAERFNNATVVVENNGVGAGTLAYLEQANKPEGTIMRDEWGVERRYHVKNLYYHQRGIHAKPGIPASAKTNKEGLARLIDALMDNLTLRSDFLVKQLQTYGMDKEVEAGEKWGILNPGKTQKGRRERHHWDRVSALIWACFAATLAPVKYRPKSQEQLEREDQEAQEAIKKGLTYNEQKALERIRAREQKAGRKMLAAKRKKKRR